MTAGPRHTAINILCRWEKTGHPIDQIIDLELHQSNISDARDRYLTFALVYGTLRWHSYLDWVLAEYSSYPLNKMKNRLRHALRIGLYQLTFMDRVPDSATVNETAKALKAAKQPGWIIGFANGLLRNIARNKDKIPHPNDENSKLPEPARLNHPVWLIKRWQERYGVKETAAFCRRNNTLPPLCLRVNSNFISRDNFRNLMRKLPLLTQNGLFAPEALVINGQKGSITELPGYLEGYFQVQDEAAQLTSLLLSPLQSNKLYLDGCAGLGGKTSHIAQMLAATTFPESASKIIAVEPSRLRIKLLKENLQRLKLSSLVTIVADKLENFHFQTNKGFAGILIDAPCSGLGVVRRHPDIRWRRKPEDLNRYQKLQLSLLDKASSLLSTGGILVYATCSMEPEENDDVVKQFLDQKKKFAITNCRDHLPLSAVDLVDEFGFLRTLPKHENVGGFFATRLVKN